MRDILPSQPRMPGNRPPAGGEQPSEPKKMLPRTLRGSTVPVTNIHVPTERKQERLASRPLFAKAPVAGSRAASFRLGPRERKVIATLIGVALIVALLAGWLFLPKASVHLILRTAPLLIDERLTIRSEPAGDPTSIPGTTFFREVDVEGSSPVTSTQVIGSPATGVVQIVNRTTQEQKIKERSRLVTADGVLFYMQTHAIVPPASGGTPARVSVPVEAADPGEAGNIEPQRLDFAALDEASQQLVYAETTQALSGGSGEEVQVVTEDDRQRALVAMLEAAKAKVEPEIRAELPEGWVLLEESWSVEGAEAELVGDVGDQVSEISFRGRVPVRVLGYEELKLEGHLRSALESRLEEEFMLFPGPISFTKSVENIDWEKAEGTIAVRVTHTTIPRLSLDALREKLAGRSQAEATAYLEGLPAVKSVSLDLWPFWVRSIPRIERRIVIELEPERQP